MKEKKLVKINPLENGGRGKQDNAALYAKMQLYKNDKLATEDEKSYDKNISVNHGIIQAGALNRNPGITVSRVKKKIYYRFVGKGHDYIDDSSD